MSRKVVSCKLCTISEVWVLFMGPSDRFVAQDPYALHNALIRRLGKHEYDQRLYPNNPTGLHNTEKTPPFYNAEVFAFVWQ